MSCDIHMHVEVGGPSKWVESYGGTPFDWRSYGMFGFLADVRNYSHVPCIKKPDYELPKDVSRSVGEDYGDMAGDAHSASSLTLRQLVEFDYDQTIWDRRVMKNGNGAALADEGEGEHLTMREFLGEEFFEDLNGLKELGGLDEVRIVFWFDN